MSNFARDDLNGQRILLVEDEWIVASQIAAAFRNSGARVVAMVPTVTNALNFINGAERLDAAVLDLNLRGEMAYPVAEALDREGIPYILATAFDQNQIATQYRDVPRCNKPFSGHQVAEFLARVLKTSNTSENARSSARSGAPNNLLLSSLPPSAWELISNELEPVQLSARTRLETCKSRIYDCYFFEDGVLSHTMRAPDGSSMEVAITGFEGMTGVPVLQSSNQAISDATLLTDASAYKIRADALADMLDKDPVLGNILRRHAQEFSTQLTLSLLAVGRFRIEARLARWMLMVSDRLGSQIVPFSQESIGLSLGVRRASITGAIRDFRHRGLIDSYRGGIKICDRQGLVAASQGCYRPLPKPLKPRH